MLDISKKDCVGCQQCANTCPKEAIQYTFVDGFVYPRINEDICISCGLCERKCPALNNLDKNNNNPLVYATWTKDEAQRLKSTSGGFCYELSKYVIECGGKVAGVVWSDDFKDAYYDIIEKLDDLYRISQTKYFQPKVYGVYKKIKKCLDDGDLVLFIGTSCYCDALKLFLEEEYSNLLLCDFICRGYTSQIFHKKRIESLEKRINSDISYVQYKNKKEGWNKFGTLFIFKNGREQFVGRDEDPYELLFGYGDFNTRPSCFDCKYRGIHRHSDITVGDFWGIKRIDKKELKNGISAVLINSDKGNYYFESIKNRLYIEKRDIVEVQLSNKALYKNFEMNEGANVFFEDLETKGMDYVLKKYLPKKKFKIFHDLSWKICELLKCDIISFIRYNFFCKSVKRMKGKYIFPYKGAKICIEKDSSVFLNDNLLLNTLKHGNSKEEMFFTIKKDAKVTINGPTSIATKSTIDVLNNSILDIGSCDTNIGIVLVCSNKIQMGYDVQIGRGVVIYDSNHHTTGLNNQKKIRPLIIGDHVWICTGATIAKGINIGSGSICGINATIMSNVKEHSLVMGNPAKTIMKDVVW